MALSQADVDRFLDETLQDNFKILPDIFRELKKEKQRLSDQVNITSMGILNNCIITFIFFKLSGHVETGSGHTEEKDSWQTVSRDTRRAISELESLKETCISLKNELTIREGSKDEKELKLKTVLPLIKDLSDLEQLRKYLLWIERGHQLRSVVC